MVWNIKEGWGGRVMTPTTHTNSALKFCQNDDHYRDHQIGGNGNGYFHVQSSINAHPGAGLWLPAVPQSFPSIEPTKLFKHLLFSIASFRPIRTYALAHFCRYHPYARGVKSWNGKIPYLIAQIGYFFSDLNWSWPVFLMQGKPIEELDYQTHWKNSLLAQKPIIKSLVMDTEGFGGQITLGRFVKTETPPKNGCLVGR